MRKNEIIILGSILALIAFLFTLGFFVNRKNIEDINKHMEDINKYMDEVHDEVLDMRELWGNIEEDFGQIETQISNIGSDSDEYPDIEATNRLINEVLDELNDFRDIGSYNHDRISFLEKEIIKQTSGAYDNYNFYYYDEADYSVRFSKDYLYRITEPENSQGGVGGALTIFLDKTKDENVTIWPWHSHGLSTTMKSVPVKSMYTDEGEVVEYVEDEIDGMNHMDFGFPDYFLKVSVRYNKDNTNARQKAMDIVKTIMFYDFRFWKYDLP